MTPLFLARYETDHYNFEIIADSKEFAMELMVDALNDHGEKYKLNEPYSKRYNTEHDRNIIYWYSEEDIVLIELNLNQVYSSGLGNHPY
jgi:hypothetical protein